MPIKQDDDERVYITAALKGILDGSPESQRERVATLFDHLTHGCKTLKRQSAADPLSAAYSVHMDIDERLQLMLSKSVHAKDVKCRKGCAHCCYMYVGIFPEEARLLRAYAAEQGIEIDEARLARQASKDEATWHELPIEDRRCVFLGDDNACRVYEHRPGNCRKYLVVSEPEFCDTVKHRGHEVGVLPSVEAETLQSAAMTVFGQGPDNMGTVMLAVKEDSKE